MGNDAVKVSISILAVLLLLALPASAQPLDTPGQVLDYLVAHRKNVALVSFSASPDGSPDTKDPVLAVNADQPMALGPDRPRHDPA
jgi:hypothetical protein